MNITGAHLQIMLIIFPHFAIFFISLVNSVEIQKVTNVCLQPKDRQIYGHVDRQTDRMRPVYPQTWF